MILYDAFYVTIRQCQYTTYQHGNMGRNHVTGEMAAVQPRPVALATHTPVQKGQPY